MSNTLTFTVGSTTYDIATYGGVLTDYRYAPGNPIYKYVEVPGRAKPIDISTAATGHLGHTSNVHQVDIAFIEGASRSANDSNATTLLGYVVGQGVTVAVFGKTIVSNITVSSYTYVGECVFVTLECTEA